MDLVQCLDLHIILELIEIHFDGNKDGDENWYYAEGQTCFLYVTFHEICRTIGISHIDV